MLFRSPDLELHNPDEGRLQLQGVEALVLPVSALPAGVDGVLGAPTLRLLPIAIDPLLDRLSLGGMALATPASADALRLKLRWQRGVPLLNLLGGGRVVAALADSGAEGLFLSEQLAERLRPRGASKLLRLVGVCGSQSVRQQRFTGLALQGEAGGKANPRSGADVEGIVTNNPIFRQLGIEAIVGQELLRHQRQLWRLDQPIPQLLLW